MFSLLNKFYLEFNKELKKNMCRYFGLKFQKKKTYKNIISSEKLSQIVYIVKMQFSANA